MLRPIFLGMFRIMAYYGPLLPPPATCSTMRHMSQLIEYRWRGPVTDMEKVTLIAAHGGQATAGWWD